MARVDGGRPVKSLLQLADGYLELRMVVIEKEKETGSRDYRVKQIEHGNIYISHMHITHIYISHTYMYIHITYIYFHVYIYIGGEEVGHY